MKRILHLSGFVLLALLSSLGIYAAVRTNDGMLAAVCFIALLLSMAWVIIYATKRPDPLPLNQSDPIASHVQDTTTLAGSASQMFSVF